MEINLDNLKTITQKVNELDLQSHDKKIAIIDKYIHDNKLEISQDSAIHDSISKLVNVVVDAADFGLHIVNEKDNIKNESIGCFNLFKNLFKKK